MIRKDAAAFQQWREHYAIKRIDLSNADLREQNLRGIDLQNANLSGADLSEAFARSADFTQATISGAGFHSANLAHVDLTGATAAGAGFVPIIGYKLLRALVYVWKYGNLIPLAQ